MSPPLGALLLRLGAVPMLLALPWEDEHADAFGVPPEQPATSCGTPLGEAALVAAATAADGSEPLHMLQVGLGAVRRAAGPAAANSALPGGPASPAGEAGVNTTAYRTTRPSVDSQMSVGPLAASFDQLAARVRHEVAVRLNTASIVILVLVLLVAAGAILWFFKFNQQRDKAGGRNVQSSPGREALDREPPDAPPDSTSEKSKSSPVPALMAPLQGLMGAARTPDVPQRSSRTSQDSVSELEGILNLPVMCKPLIMPENYMRLAIPLESLTKDRINIDICAITGEKLLHAAMGAGISTSIQITLVEKGGAASGTHLALVTPARQILGGNGTYVGTLLRQGPQHFTLRDRTARKLLKLLPDDHAACPREVRIDTEAGGISQRCGYARKCRPKVFQGLENEHYELEVNPGIDPVLLVSCLLALIVFALPENEERRESLEAAVDRRSIAS